MLESKNGDEAVEGKDTLRHCGLGVGIWVDISGDVQGCGGRRRRYDVIGKMTY